MRAWERVAYLEHCGGCGRELSVDEPVQTITTHGLNRKLLRGVCCADGAPPADLAPRPTRIVLEDQVSRMQALQSAMPQRTRGALKKAAAEWKPYREPGEDDD